MRCHALRRVQAGTGWLHLAIAARDGVDGVDSGDGVVRVDGVDLTGCATC